MNEANVGTGFIASSSPTSLDGLSRTSTPAPIHPAIQPENEGAINRAPTGETRDYALATQRDEKGDAINRVPTGGRGEDEIDVETLREAYRELQAQKNALEMRVLKSEERRRALMHILSDLNTVNRKLADQRKAMIHILADYEHDRSRLARQKERLDNSRRALMHILQDSHSSNLRLENSRKAMIHIMSDLRETTEEVQQREQELREKQEQLVQAGKLATLGELTTGVAHELNNPLNNIGLFVGNAVDLVDLGVADRERIVRELKNAMQQVRKATEIISHLRTFGRVASVSREPVSIDQVIER